MYMFMRELYLKNLNKRTSTTLSNFYKDKKKSKKGYCIKLIKLKKSGKLITWVVASSIKFPNVIYSKLGYYKFVGSKKVFFISIDQITYWLLKNAYITYKVRRLLFFTCVSGDFKSRPLVIMRSDININLNLQIPTSKKIKKLKTGLDLVSFMFETLMKYNKYKLENDGKECLSYKEFIRIYMPEIS